MERKDNTYRFAVLTEVTVEASSKRFARTILTGMQRSIKALEAFGFSPVHGTYSSKVGRSAEHPNPKRVSQATINKSDIRITNVFDLKNLLVTGGFEDTGFSELETLFDWLTDNAPDVKTAFLPDFLRDMLAPFTQHIHDLVTLAGPKFKRIVLYEQAVKSFNDPAFAVFVKVEIPIRMYRPDGEHSSNWSYTRSIYGFGPDYESAIRSAYQIIQTMREQRLV